MMHVFVHIPKTAGTTLHKIVVHQSKPGTVIVRHDSEGPFSAAYLEVLRELDGHSPLMMLGHLSVGLHYQMPEVRYLTCLREPVERLVSHYHHARTDPDHYLHQPLMEHEWSFADYVTSGVSGELENGMTRMLAGMGDFHQDKVTDETLAQAKNHLAERFDAVIFNQQFDAHLLHAADVMKWHAPYYIRRKVGKGTNVPISAKERQIAAEHSQFDVELYQWAQQHFSLPCTAESAKRLARFQLANATWGKALVIAREIRHRLVSRYQTIP